MPFAKSLHFFFFRGSLSDIVTMPSQSKVMQNRVDEEVEQL
jgi:hypothetical protein